MEKILKTLPLMVIVIVFGVAFGAPAPDSDSIPVHVVYHDYGTKNLEAKPQSYAEQYGDVQHLAENIIYESLDELRDNVRNTSLIKDQDWERLNDTIKDQLTNLPSTSQNGNDKNPIQIIVLGFQNATSNFLNRFNRTDQTSLGQNLLNSVSQGFTKIQQQLNEIGNRATTQSTILGETSTAGAPIVQGAQTILNQLGQAINNINPFISTSPKPGAQSDTSGAPPSNPIIQGAQTALNQFGQAINNLNPFNSPNPTVPSDTPGNDSNSNPIVQNAQNVLNQIGQAINNINPFSTPKPSAQGDPTNTNPSNPIVQGAQTVLNQVGSAINNLNIFSSTPKPGSQGDTPSNPSNPIIQGAQTVLNQVGSAINNINPFASSTPKPAIAAVVPVQAGLDSIPGPNGTKTLI